MRLAALRGKVPPGEFDFSIELVLPGKRAAKQDGATTDGGVH